MLASGVTIHPRDSLFFDSAWEPIGVTEQFIENAETYQERYFSRLDFHQLVRRCVQVAGINADAALHVLDIGSGGGSSVFALCEIAKSARVVASDISPDLLRFLANFVAGKPDLDDRVTVFCYDLHRPLFRESIFDVVLGAAILHHLIDPEAALRNVASSLKPGGKLILVEPLEAGSLMLCVLFEQVLTELRRLGHAEGPLAGLMRAMRTDIQARIGVPVAKPFTPELDDKWVFNEPYLVGLAESLGLSRVELFPAQEDVSRAFGDSFRSLLRDSGNADAMVPDTVDKLVNAFDNGISPELKARLCPTGIIVFTK